ncbi:MAG: ATP-binding cassette domain-containing protein [Acidimicrobiia bacterium]|nr:ATP-binding cassette domain-containing protein [Acidimicrobiia bacterium]
MAGSGTAHLRRPDEVLLRVENLVVEFPVGNTGLKVNAVSDVSLDLRPGETLGLVGESGCGKSTTGRAIMQLPKPTSGHVLLDGQDITTATGVDLRAARSQMQMIFQDPISSLNPRRRVAGIVAEPLTVRWLDSFPHSPVSRAWEAYTRRLVGWWYHLWRWGRLTLPLLILAALTWVVGTRAAESAGPEEELSGIAEALSKLVDVTPFVAVPAAALAAPFVAAFAATAAVWLVLVVVMPIAAIPRTVKVRRDRPRFRREADAKVREVLDTVGLDPDIAMPKRPHEFSGGQCQRICIARALVLDPHLLICDEPVSSLDVSVQAQVLNLLEDLKARYGLTLIFIAHDLAVVKNVSDRVAVMYLGKVCEVALSDEIYERPAHPYSAALLSSIPEPDPTIPQRGAPRLEGELPSPIAPPSGCRFRTRCPRAAERCAEEEPVLRALAEGHFVACHFPLTEPAAAEREVAAALAP